MTMQDLYKDYLMADERLSFALNKYEQGCALLAQLSVLDTMYVPPSVESYLRDLNDSGLVSTESLIQVNSPVIDTIKRVLAAIYDAIVYIIKCIYDIFRWIFDMYYRAQRKFVKQQQFLLQFTDPALQDKFKNSTMTTVAKADFIKFNTHLNNLVLTLQSGARVASFEHVGRLFVDCENSMGVKLNSSEIVNLVDASNIEKTGVIGNLGWDYAGVCDAIALMILTAHDTVTLKRLNSLILTSAKDLESKVNEAVKNNAHPSSVTHLQEQLGMQRQLHTFVKSGLTIIATRMIWMDKYFSAFIDRMRDIQSGK